MPVKGVTDDKTIKLRERDSSVTNNNKDNNKIETLLPLEAPINNFRLPEWINSDDWKDFEDMRRKKRRAMTDRARSLAVKNLDELRIQGHDPAAVIQQSILRGWDSFYPIKAQSQTIQAPAAERQYQQANDQRLMDELMGVEP